VSKIILDIMSGPSANPNSVAEILLARPPKKPFWHTTGAVRIPHTISMKLMNLCTSFRMSNVTLLDITRDPRTKPSSYAS
jgi:hypothetical protein